MTTNKYVFFNNLIDANRFASIYGGIVSTDDSFTRFRFGDKVNGKVWVYCRASNETMEKLKVVLGLTEKRYNNKKCYVCEKSIPDFDPEAVINCIKACRYLRKHLEEWKKQKEAVK